MTPIEVRVPTTKPDLTPKAARVLLRLLAKAAEARELTTSATKPEAA